jgi:hypothetical protein
MTEEGCDSAQGRGIRTGDSIPSRALGHSHRGICRGDMIGASRDVVAVGCSVALRRRGVEGWCTREMRRSLGEGSCMDCMLGGRCLVEGSYIVVRVLVVVGTRCVEGCDTAVRARGSRYVRVSLLCHCVSHC